MSIDPGADGVDLDRQLHEARKRLESVRAQRTSAAAGVRDSQAAVAQGGDTGGAGLAVRGVGEALEGQVRAVASAGRLERLELESRLMRGPLSQLGDPITQAVNTALEDLRSRTATAADTAGNEPVIDTAVLADRLAEAQAQGMRMMGVITDGLADAMARIRERTSVSGDPGPQGLEQVLESTARSIDLARTAPAEPDTPAVTGRGSDPDGQVQAIAAPGGRIGSVSIQDSTGRSPASYVLAGQVVTAVNAALDDLAAQQAEQLASTQPDLDQLTERLREVQDLSLQQMRAYTGALQNMMSSIQGPPR